MSLLTNSNPNPDPSPNLNLNLTRFDANCYVSLTHTLDSHDVGRSRGAHCGVALAAVRQPVLVVGITSDVLCTL